ncbi:hypothetical protein ACFL05_00670 [Patescibacteria group bacterium]
MNARKIASVIVCIVFIVSGGVFLFSVFYEINKADQEWLETATQEQKIHVQDMKKKLKIIRPYDFIVFRDGKFGYITSIGGGIEYKQFMFGSKGIAPSSEHSSDRLIYSIKKFVPKESKEYDALARKFLQHKGKI